MATIKAKAAKLNWELEQGVDFDDVFTYKEKASGNPIDLTGYSARMKIKLNRSDATDIDELTTVNGRIVLGGAAGTIQCIWSAADTAAYYFGSAHYDLEIVSGGGKVYRLLTGKILVSRETTT